MMSSVKGHFGVTEHSNKDHLTLRPPSQLVSLLSTWHVGLLTKHTGSGNQQSRDEVR